MSVMKFFRSNISSSSTNFVDLSKENKSKESINFTRHKLGTRIYAPIKIILLQDTLDMYSVKNKVNNMLRDLYEKMQDETICIVIRYRTDYQKIELYAGDFIINKISMLISCSGEDNSCFFDVLNYVFNSIISKYLCNEVSLLGLKVNTSHIDVIAVGNAKDTCSITTCTEVMKFINMINNDNRLSLKYFLVDTSKIENVMKIGIRNIITFEK